MKIGILGSGDVGQALGRGLARHGHEVTIGTRSPEKLAAWMAETGGRAHVGSFAEAARHGELVIVATSGEGTEHALELAGVDHFSGKLVLDATNPLDYSKGMPPALFTGPDDSLGERVQRKLPRAHVVKCFNTVSNTQMVDPTFAEGVPPMMIAGNDAGAKARTDAFLRTLGWPGALDCGDIVGARWLEALVPLWVRVGLASQAWGHSFRVVR